MLIFNIGIKILLAITVIFFIVFFYLCFVWSGIYTKRERLGIAATVTFIYSFVIFAAGAVVVALISAAWRYLPRLF